MYRPSKLLQGALALILFSGYGCASLVNVALTPPGGSSASVDPAEERRVAAEERKAEQKKREGEREAEQKKRAEEDAAKEKALFDEMEDAVLGNVYGTVAYEKKYLTPKEAA